MAWRHEARSFRNVSNRQFGILGKQAFRIIDAEAGNPIAERCAIRRFDILRQIGAVSLKHIRKLLYGKAGLNIAIRINPTFDFSCYFSMEKGSSCLCTCSGLLVTQTFFFRRHFCYHCIFHLFVKQQIILVATVEIDVKRN